MRTRTRKAKSLSSSPPLPAQSLQAFVKPVLSSSSPENRQQTERVDDTNTGPGSNFYFGNIPILSPAAIAIQAKLTIGRPNDKYEQEADRVADTVMRMPESGIQRQEDVGEDEEDKEKIQTKSLSQQITPLIQRQADNAPEEDEEEKETLQAKPFLQRKAGEGERNEVEEGKALQASAAPGQASAVTSGVVSGVNAMRGGGQSLSPASRAFMEPRFGHDFSKVRIHADSSAANTSKQISARAFTVGRNIAFGAGQYQPNSTTGRQLLAHELTHVVQQGGADLRHTDQRNEKRKQQPVSKLTFFSTPSRTMQRRALLAAEETAAIASGRGLFDNITVRVLQTITRVPAADRDGVIGTQTVRAISDWQSARGLHDNGIVNQASMDRLVTDSLVAAPSRAEHGIQLVLDFYNLNTSTDTLTVRHRTGVSTFEGFRFIGGILPILDFSPASTTFEEGNLRVIEVGDPAFASATALRDNIQRELARAAPVRGPVGAIPARLDATEERNAVRYTALKYSDQRSVRAIQGLVGAPVNGTVDVTTVQFIAEAQHTAGIGIDGKVGIITTENFYTRMIARGNPNSALRLLVDYFNMRDEGNLLSVYYDPTVAALASTDYRPSEPVRVRVGPNALTLPFSGAVHNIAHEMEHVRRLKEGIVPAATHEFLGEALEILSVGMPEEPLDPVVPSHDAFINDATRALANWNAMPVADRRTFRRKFIAVRRKVLRRIDAGTAAQRAANAALRGNYVAVVLP